MKDYFLETQLVYYTEFLMVGRLAYVQVAAKVDNLETLKKAELLVDG